MQALQLDDFAPLCGEVFTLTVDGERTLLMRLIEAAALPMPQFKGRQAFSLMFDGPAEPQLPQRIYRLEHAGRPSLEIFLVPVAADQGSVRYQAIFT